MASMPNRARDGKFTQTWTSKRADLSLNFHSVLNFPRRGKASPLQLLTWMRDLVSCMSLFALRASKADLDIRVISAAVSNVNVNDFLALPQKRGIVLRLPGEFTLLV